MNNRAMLMMLAGQGARQHGRHIGVDYEDWGPRQEYGEQDLPQSRFRDRRGREHYDNGRFAPQNDGGYWVESRQGGESFRGRSGSRSARYDGGYGGQPESRYPGREGPRDWYDPYTHGGEAQMNMIGFSGGDGFRRQPGMDASYPTRDEMAYRAGHASGGHSGSSMVMPLDRQTAEEWASLMENSDGTRGPHWTMDQTEQVRMKQGIDCDPLKWWVTMNMMYSDYCKVAEKMGVNTPDFYACMSKAFLDDKDAQPDKLARYYEYIVRR